MGTKALKSLVSYRTTTLHSTERYAQPKNNILKKVILHPLKGIEFENNEIIEFGTSKTELFKKHGQPSSVFEKKLFYDKKELRINIGDSEAAYCYAFHESAVGIFRDSCESDVNEMIEEMTANGENPENENWVVDGKQKAKYFWTVGIDRLDYYK